MPTPTDPPEPTIVRWSLPKTLGYFLIYGFSLLISAAMIWGSIAARPFDFIVVFSLLPVGVVGFLISAGALAFGLSFFGGVFLRDYAIYISADYRSIFDTRGNIWIADRHEPMRFAKLVAVFPEYARQDGTSLRLVTIRREGSWLLDRLLCRRLMLPLCFARHAGLMIRHLVNARSGRQAASTVGKVPR